MDFSQAFDGPVVATVNGQEVTFQHLTTRDYLKWVAELTESRRVAAKKAVPPTLQGIDRFKVMRSVELEQASLDDIAPQLDTPDGAIRVLKMSLDKGKVPEPDKIIDAMTTAQQRRVGVEVCGLFEIRRGTMIQVEDVFRVLANRLGREPTFMEFGQEIVGDKGENTPDPLAGNESSPS